MAVAYIARIGVSITAELLFISLRTSRAGGIRTRGLLNPIQALYQAEPRPVPEWKRIQRNYQKGNRNFPGRATLLYLDTGADLLSRFDGERADSTIPGRRRHRRLLGQARHRMCGMRSRIVSWFNDHAEQGAKSSLPRMR
jgi:hypothetical protein